MGTIGPPIFVLKGSEQFRVHGEEYSKERPLVFANSVGLLELNAYIGNLISSDQASGGVPPPKISFSGFGALG